MANERITERAIELLQRLIEVPRISREEKAAADLLEDYMKGELGLEVKRMGNNLWSLQPSFDPEKQTLLLNAHIDTVKPVAGWQRDPFKATREGSRIYGLGANDDGASLVSLLHVFAALKDEDSLYNLVFLASAEEEVSGKGGIESVLPLLPKIDIALVGEPTGMQPAIAEKGLMVLDVTAHGKAGHAARDEGENAIYKALEDIEWFRNYKWEKVSPLLGPVKMTVTIVNAGTQHNVVPDACSFVVDVRPNGMYANPELLALIQAALPSIDIRARSTRLGSSHLQESSAVVRRGLSMGLEAFGSPTCSNQTLCPFPTLKIGPGDSARSHTADEFIRLHEIREGIDIFVRLLDQLEL